MGVKAGPACHLECEGRDADRLKKADQKMVASTKEARTARRLARLAAADLDLDDRDAFYGPGIDQDW